LICKCECKTAIVGMNARHNRLKLKNVVKK
jgi:hypothetical protein